MDKLYICSLVTVNAAVYKLYICVTRTLRHWLQSLVTVSAAVDKPPNSTGPGQVSPSTASGQACLLQQTAGISTNLGFMAGLTSGYCTLRILQIYWSPKIRSGQTLGIESVSDVCASFRRMMLAVIKRSLDIKRALDSQLLYNKRSKVIIMSGSCKSGDGA
ncbi:hypothetical protein RRG08_037976 [Elysia crispata]|uniref:Uncharacterized protein n=1 Tax=Elysia crispata TaxID=231223 RepID=A0AAE1DVZ7_9GAST|nr:hypothetical protein RRG08_037976 [Elysia crispata]